MFHLDKHRKPQKQSSQQHCSEKGSQNSRKHAQWTERNKKTWLTSWLLEMSRIFSRSLMWRVTSFKRSFSLFPMTCTFSLASRQSLPSALTSNWQDISCSDATFNWDSSSSRLICCCQGKHQIFLTAVKKKKRKKLELTKLKTWN